MAESWAGTGNSTTDSNVIISTVDISQIAGVWSTKFKELHNHRNLSTRNSLQEQLNSIITEDDLETLIVDSDTVICAIK